MNLHTNTEDFNNAILITSGNTNVAPDFIEKDYWISLVLKRLSESKYVDSGCIQRRNISIKGT